VRHIVEDCHGYIWITRLGGVGRFDGEDFRTFITADSLASDSVWSVFEDRRGHMWFSTSGGGTGLCSSTSYNIVPRHKGWIYVGECCREGIYV